MALVEHFETEQNFWELFPELKVAGPFKRLYQNDSSENKEESSNLVWFVALVTDINSKFYVLEEKERMEIVGGEFFGSENYAEGKEELIDELREFYAKFTDTPAQRALRAWERKMEQRAKFIENTGYETDYMEQRMTPRGMKEVKVVGTHKMLDDMMLNTTKLYTEYKRILQEMEAERTGSGVAKGGGEVSLGDSGEI